MFCCSFSASLRSRSNSAPWACSSDCLFSSASAKVFLAPSTSLVRLSYSSCRDSCFCFHSAAFLSASAVFSLDSACNCPWARCKSSCFCCVSARVFFAKAISSSDSFLSWSWVCSRAFNSFSDFVRLSSSSSRRVFTDSNSSVSLLRSLCRASCFLLEAINSSLTPANSSFREASSDFRCSIASANSRLTADSSSLSEFFSCCKAFTSSCFCDSSARFSSSSWALVEADSSRVRRTEAESSEVCFNSFWSLSACSWFSCFSDVDCASNSSIFFRRTSASSVALLSSSLASESSPSFVAKSFSRVVMLPSLSAIFFSMASLSSLARAAALENVESMLPIS
ncbi:hypothetical protein F4814DRAFT_399324 [Daldinia grandis]|nr:hypothetical protein F4814DRAFT_399324 [Daldinia grandis]